MLASETECQIFTTRWNNNLKDTQMDPVWVCKGSFSRFLKKRIDFEFLKPQFRFPNYIKMEDHEKTKVYEIPKKRLYYVF